jgi:hypothetical protein
MASHVSLAMLSWSFGPLLQIGWVALLGRWLRPDRRMAEWVDLYFAGQGPWLLWLAAVSGACVCLPDAAVVLRALFGWGVLAGGLLGVLLWSAVVTLAFFRAGLGLPRGRAMLAAAASYAAYYGSLAAWYALTHQLGPLVATRGPT